MYLLYLVRFELVGLYTACTSHIPLLSESDPSSLCLCALVLRQRTISLATAPTSPSLATRSHAHASNADEAGIHQQSIFAPVHALDRTLHPRQPRKHHPPWSISSHTISDLLQSSRGGSDGGSDIGCAAPQHHHQLKICCTPRSHHLLTPLPLSHCVRLAWAVHLVSIFSIFCPRSGVLCIRHWLSVLILPSCWLCTFESQPLLYTLSHWSDPR